MFTEYALELDRDQGNVEEEDAQLPQAILINQSVIAHTEDQSGSNKSEAELMKRMKQNFENGFGKSEILRK